MRNEMKSRPAGKIAELMEKAQEEAKITIEKPYYLHSKIMANVNPAPRAKTQGFTWGGQIQIKYSFDINFVRKIIKIAVGSIVVLMPSLLHGQSYIFKYIFR
jgi:hypothetical protein